jgi:hypothetical protein
MHLCLAQNPDDVEQAHTIAAATTTSPLEINLRASADL